jgi:AcrR family transcriptional regulator
VVIKQRARRAEHKHERRAAILAAGRKAFEAQPYEAITMADVAQRAGLAKGTLYLYFGTREELFLALLEDELFAWLEGVARRLARRTSPVPPAHVARLLAGSLAVRPVLVRLLAVLHGLLERNVGVERALAFKQALMARSLTAAAALEAALGLPHGSGLRLLLHLDALVAGLAQLADPAPVVRELLEERVELRPFRVDFGRELEAALRALLDGLQARARRARRRAR